MNNTNLSVSAFIAGPLLRTPEGWIVIGYSIAYVTWAIAVSFFGISPPSGMTDNTVAILSVFWPLMLFIKLARETYFSYSQWKKSLSLLAYGAAPLVVFWALT